MGARQRLLQRRSPRKADRSSWRPIVWNAAQQFESDDFVAQVEQALRHIVEVLAEPMQGHSTWVRLTWYVTDSASISRALSEVGQPTAG